MKVNLEWTILYTHYDNILSSFKAWKIISDKLESNSLEIFNGIIKPVEGEFNSERVTLEQFLKTQFDDIKYEWDISDYERLVQTYRKSGVLTIYSLLENHLKSIAKEVQFEFEFRIKIDDLKGDGYIEQYLNFLHKVFELNVEELNSSLTKLKQRRTIRNRIAHNAEFTQEQVSRISNVRGIDIVTVSEDKYSILIHRLFIDELIQTCEDFFRLLLLSIDKRYSELR